MERKIGEIFEYNGEWLQCVEQPEKYDKTVCFICAFQGNGNCELDRCSGTYRSDKKFVIFKKLEKVGEPYSYYFPTGRIIYFQRYECYQEPIIEGDIIWHWVDPTWVGIEIKQNKENNMEEKKLNLKPFDLGKAKSGKQVCTRDGRKARIICFDRDWDMHIVALVSDPLGESVHYYLSNGKVDFDKQNDEDLMMLPEKKEGWINVYKERCYETKEEAIRHIAPGTHYIDTIRVEWEDKE